MFVVDDSDSLAIMYKLLPSYRVIVVSPIDDIARCVVMQSEKHFIEYVRLKPTILRSGTHRNDEFIFKEIRRYYFSLFDEFILFCFYQDYGHL